MSDLTAEVRAALAAATPGPWGVYETIHADNYVVGPRGFMRDDIVAGPTYNRENSLLIASAPSWLAALCDRLDAAEAKLAAAKAALSPHTTEAHGCTCTECQIARILNGDPDAE